MLFLIGTACVLSVLLVLIISLFCDADVTTLAYEKWGKDLKNELQGKVVWITGASTGIVERNEAFYSWLFRQIQISSLRNWSSNGY